jgi:broad specificity phosphatase PhoE
MTSARVHVIGDWCNELELRAGKDVVAVTHGGLLSALHKHIMKHAACAVKNCAYCEVLSDGANMVVVSWNVTVKGDSVLKAASFGGGNFG